MRYDEPFSTHELSEYMDAKAREDARARRMARREDKHDGQEPTSARRIARMRAEEENNG